jgi:hypothetical protein
MGTVLRLLGIGWFVALCLLGGVFGGLWLDDRLETRPLMTMIGLGGGLAVAGIGTYRMLMAVVSQSGMDQSER